METSRLTPRSRTSARSFGDVPGGALLAYRDAGGSLALAVNGGSAAALLDVRRDDELVLRAR